jgi:hypothetical protein
MYNYSLGKDYTFNLREEYKDSLLIGGSRPNKLQSANAQFMAFTSISQSIKSIMVIPSG